MISFVDFESDSFRIFTRVDPKVGKPSASGDISTLHLAINRDSMDIWNVLAERLEMSDEEKLYQMNRFICQYSFVFLLVLSEEDNMNRTIWTYGQYGHMDNMNRLIKSGFEEGDEVFKVFNELLSSFPVELVLQIRIKNTFCKK